MNRMKKYIHTKKTTTTTTTTKEKKKEKKEISPLREWGSLTIAFLGKFAKQITILSCHSSMPVPYGDWKG